MNPVLADLGRELAAEALFDEGVEAARNACVAGASIAAAAITAAAWYDNPLTGTPALLACMEKVGPLPLDVERWTAALAPTRHPETGDPDFAPGFGFLGGPRAEAVHMACARLVGAREGGQGAPRGAFFLEHRRAIEDVAGPLNQAGLAALLFLDHGIDATSAERMFLVWRIETAIGEAQRARSAGLARFPFFQESYVYDGHRPPERALDLGALRRELDLV